MLSLHDSFIKTLEKLFFNHCILCHATLKTCDQDNLICNGCYIDLPWIKQSCQQCGIPLPYHDKLICGQCLQTPRAFDQVIALFNYSQPIDRYISDLKFHSHLPYSRFFGESLAKHILQNEIVLPECIIPVPLHRERLQQRGFNQALEIAKPLRNILKLPIEQSLIKRTRATLPQSSTPAKERSKNLRDSFTIASKARYQHVAIVDDVVTTTATIQELAKTLRNAGVEKIDVWCCARTSLLT